MPGPARARRPMDGCRVGAGMNGWARSPATTADRGRRPGHRGDRWLARAQGLTIDHLRSAQTRWRTGRSSARARSSIRVFWAIRCWRDFRSSPHSSSRSSRSAISASRNWPSMPPIRRSSPALGGGGRGGTRMQLDDFRLPRRSPRRRKQLPAPAGTPHGCAGFRRCRHCGLPRSQPPTEIAPLARSHAEITSYAAVMANASPGRTRDRGNAVTRSGLIRHLTPEFAGAIEELMATGIGHFFQIRSLGGAVGDVAPDATAFGHRAANFSVVASGTDRTRLDEAWEDMYQHFRGVDLSFETDTRAERLGDAFPAATLERLRASSAATIRAMSSGTNSTSHLPPPSANYLRVRPGNRACGPFGPRSVVNAGVTAEQVREDEPGGAGAPADRAVGDQLAAGGGDGESRRNWPASRNDPRLSQRSSTGWWSADGTRPARPPGSMPPEGQNRSPRYSASERTSRMGGTRVTDGRAQPRCGPRGAGCSAREGCNW